MAKRLTANGESREGVERFITSQLDDFEGNEPASTPTHLRGLAMAGFQGALLGFGDQASGALHAMFGGGYEAGRSAFNKELSAWGEAHGYAKFGAELAGSLLTGGALTRGAFAVLGRAFPAVRAVEPTLGQRLFAAAAQGGVGGAIAGAGYAEGDLSERVTQALLGAGVGTVAGGATGAVVEGLGSVLRPATRSITRGSPRTQRALTGSNPQTAADDQLVRGLNEEGITLDVLEQRAQASLATGVPVTFVDLVDETGPVFGMLREALTARTPETQLLVNLARTRAADQPARVSVAMFSALTGVKRGGLDVASDLVDQLGVRRKALADPFYKVAYTQTATLTPEIRRLFSRPIVRAAYKRGAARAADEDVGGRGHGLLVPDLQTILATGRAPIRALDYTRQGLDDLVEARKITAKQARRFSGLIETMRDEAAKQSPELAAALSVWRGFSSALDAVTLGKDALRLAPPEITKRVAKLDPAQRAFARLGLAAELSETFTKQPERLSKYFATNAFRGTSSSFQAQQVRALVADPDLADEFLAMLAVQARVQSGANALSGPARGQSVQQLERALEGQFPAPRGNIKLVLASALSRGAHATQSRFRQDTNNEVLRTLLAGADDPFNLLAAISRLRRAAVRVERRSRPSSTGAFVAGAQAARLLP